MNEPEAAVAILRTPAPDRRVLLIRRSERDDDSWSGHWSFPGGRRDPQDPDLLHTALRELEEECGIGLAGKDLERALPLAVARRRTGPFVSVAPFVFAVDRELSPVLDPREAAHSVWVPVSTLRNPGCHRLLPVPRLPQTFLFPAIELPEMPLWGFTYRLITEWLGVLPPPEASLHAAGRLLEFLLSRGMTLEQDWTDGPVRTAAVRGAFPGLPPRLWTASEIPPVNAVEVRPEAIRIAGLAFEEYVIHMRP